jgi:rubrerythrin
MWRCRYCQNVAGNFAHRDACAICGQPKPAITAA